MALHQTNAMLQDLLWVRIVNENERSLNNIKFRSVPEKQEVLKWVKADI